MCYDIGEYIKDLDVKIIQYAGNTKMLKAINTDENPIKLQKAVDNLELRTKRNRLKLNANKTYYITYLRTNEYINQII